MSTRKIVAIGGGENGRIKEGVMLPYETGPMDEEIIRLTGKQHPNFLLLAHAQPLENQERYFNTMKDIYGGKYGCECKELKSDKLADAEYVKSLIERADIIYEGGGDTLSMIKLWKETGFDKLLEYARKNGKVMCGVSAGGNCWFKECSSDSLKILKGPDQPLIGMDCLGFVDGLFVPHSDAPGRQESVKDLLKNESKEIGLLLSNCAALEIVDDQYRIITSDASNYPIKKAFGKKTYWKNVEYIEEELDDSGEFKALSELYSKL